MGAPGARARRARARLGRVTLPPTPAPHLNARQVYVGDVIDCVAVLGRALAPLTDHLAQFKAEFDDLPDPKWAPPARWTRADDARLLVGVWRHGLGRWAAMAGDAGLGLGDKLAQAAQERHQKEAANAPGLEHLPRGTHLETRALGLLRRLRHAVEGGPPPGRTRGRSKSRTPTPAREPAPPPPVVLSDGLLKSAAELAALATSARGDARLKSVVQKVGAQVGALAGSRGGPPAAAVWAAVAAQAGGAWSGAELERTYESGGGGGGGGVKRGRSSDGGGA